MRLACWSAAFAAGIACGLAGLPAWALWGLAGAGSAAGAALLWRRRFGASIGIAALLVGLGLGRRELERAEAPPPIAEDTPVEVLAEVLRGSDVTEARGPAGEESASEPAGNAIPPSGRARLRLRVASVAGRPVAAELSLTVLEGVPDLAPGDWVRFIARLHAPWGFANPGISDGRLQARARGIELLACVRRPTDLAPAEGPRGPLARLRGWAYRLRRAMSAAINRPLREPAAGFVRAMVVGERTVVPRPIEEGFRAAGATHVLSVSGLHLAVVVALIFRSLVWLFGRCPSWALRVPPRAAASALALPAAAFYTLVTGEAVATVRSAVMASVVLGAAIVNRPASLAASLGAAAGFLLVDTPAVVLDVSFQLSFASVIALGLFARRLLPAGARTPTSGWRRARGWVAASLSASLAACLLTTPIVAHHFGELTPAAPLGNLLLVPMVELVVLPCGLAGALLALAHPWLGALPLLVAGWASDLAILLAAGFRELAPVFLVRYPNVGETLLLVAGAACALEAMARTTHRRRWWRGAVAAALLATLSLGARELARRAREDLRVTFLDVGQGDAVLVEGPGGFTALVDGGGRYDGSFDTGARVLEPVLRTAGIGRLDLVVLSHAHPDHLNGLFAILERFTVGALWTHGDGGRNPAFERLLELAERRAIPRPPPTRLAVEGLTLEAVGPWYDGKVGVPPGLSANDASLVVRLAFAGRRVLLTGDIGDEGEAELLARQSDGLELGAEVLKVPHHGSRHASTAAFLHAVVPVLAVASAGRFNRFGLPSRAAIARYQARGIELLRTDRDGAVTVTFARAGGLRIECARGCGR